MGRQIAITKQMVYKVFIYYQSIFFFDWLIILSNKLRMPRPHTRLVIDRVKVERGLDCTLNETFCFLLLLT